MKYFLTGCVGTVGQCSVVSRPQPSGATPSPHFPCIRSPSKVAIKHFFGIFLLVETISSPCPLVAAGLKWGGVLLAHPGRLQLLAARLPLQLKTLQVQVILHHLLLIIAEIKRCIQLGGLAPEIHVSQPSARVFLPRMLNTPGCGWQLAFQRPDLSQPEPCHRDIPDRTSEST